MSINTCETYNEAGLHISHGPFIQSGQVTGINQLSNSSTSASLTKGLYYVGTKLPKYASLHEVNAIAMLSFGSAETLPGEHLGKHLWRLLGELGTRHIVISGCLASPIANISLRKFGPVFLLDSFSFL